MIARVLLSVTVLSVTVAFGSARGAHATFAGANGNIVFVSNRAGGAQNDIYLMNPDGTGRVNLTRHPADYRGPRWSADGRTIVFSSTRSGDGLQIYTMAADGGNVHELTIGMPPPNVQPSFTSGGQIAFTHGSFPNRTLYLMNSDGTSPRSLTSDAADNAWPAPSPTGPFIAFARYDGNGGERLMLLNLSSHQVKQLTSPGSLDDAEPNWSPTGNDLVFARSGDVDSDVFVVHRDGSGLTQLTSSPTRVDTRPAFSPDGTRIVFSGCTSFGTPDQRCGLFTMPAAGGSPTDISTITAPYVDTFSGDLLDPFWTIESQGSGIDVTQTNGELEFHLGPATTVGPDGFVDVGAFMNCRLPGAFDVQVDYTLVSGPLPPGVIQDLNAVEFTGGAFTGTHGVFVFNPGFGSPGVSTNFPGGQNVFAPDTSLSGTLRLVGSVGPNGRTVTAYRKVGDSFVQMLTSSPYSTDETAFNLDVFSNLSPFPYPSVTVAYDNFRISSGDISCPSWWDDDFPDWQAVPSAD